MMEIAEQTELFATGRFPEIVRSYPMIRYMGSKFRLLPWVHSMKRYHFLEGLSCYWEGVEIMDKTRVKKIAKPFTPFSYRKTAVEAFDRMFKRFANSIIVLSYSSNGYPELSDLKRILSRYKSTVIVHQREHRYHFGTHNAASRNDVMEYLVVGR